MGFERGMGWELFFKTLEVVLSSHMSHTHALLRSAILIYGPYKIRTDRKSSYEP